MQGALEGLVARAGFELNCEEQAGDWLELALECSPAWLGLGLCVRKGGGQIMTNRGEAEMAS